MKGRGGGGEGGGGEGGEGGERINTSCHCECSSELPPTYVHLEVGGPEATLRVLKDAELLMSAGTLWGSWLGWSG